MRVYRRLHVRLPKRHRDKLDNVLRGGIQPVRVVLRALALSQNAKGKVPRLVFMHGGPIRQMMLGFHYMDYYHNAYAENQYLASRGYAVLSVNYRLGVMYGRAFREAPNTVWRGAAEYKDV